MTEPVALHESFIDDEQPLSLLQPLSESDSEDGQPLRKLQGRIGKLKLSTALSSETDIKLINQIKTKCFL